MKKIFFLVVFVGSALYFLLPKEGLPKLDFDALKKVVLSRIGMSDVAEVRSVPKIQKVRGTVMISDKSSPERLAKDGELISQGSTIETKDQSTALIVFGDKYSVQIRLASNSLINIDDLMRVEPTLQTEKSLINLIKGAIFLMVTNKGMGPELSVKSKGAVFAVRGTVFSVNTDGNYSLLIVKEGKVEAENFTTFKKQIIESGSNYLLNKDGQDKKITNPEFVNGLEWNMQALDKEQPPMDELLSKLGNPDLGPNLQQVAVDKDMQDKLDLIKLEIDAFKQYDKDLQDYLANDTDFLNQLQKLVKEETPKINNDIHCLSTSRSQCELYSENLLHSRDFPRTFGAPRLIQMMIEELKKYMKEQDEKVAVATKDLADLEALIAKRKVVLQEVEKQFNEQTSLETIVPRLKDSELIRQLKKTP